MAGPENGLQDWLGKRQFYNIKSKSLEHVVEVLASPLPGSPPVSDDQGEEPVCTSHAVGKCMVDILDGFGYDCSQEEIVESLKERVQPKHKAVRFEAFEGVGFDVSIWKRGTDSTITRKVPICLKIQRQPRVNIANWRGPVTSDLRKEHHLSVAGIWEYNPNARKEEERYHAVYIDEFTKNPGTRYIHLLHFILIIQNQCYTLYLGNGYTLKCINSWGTLKEPNPELSNKKFTDLFYVSLYSYEEAVARRNLESEEEKYLLVSTQGKSAEKNGVANLLGLYKETGIPHNDAKCYKQVHTLNEEDEMGYIYRHCDAKGTWFFSRNLETGSEDCVLKMDTTLTLNDVPKKGWKYNCNGRWIIDHQLEIETLSQPPEDYDIDIRASADAHIDCLGTFKPFENLYSCGRRVYKHSEKNYFLMGKQYWHFNTYLILGSGSVIRK